MNENPVKNFALKFINSTKNMRLFRNNNGSGFQANANNVVEYDNGNILLRHPRRIKFGLMAGSGDLIGWNSIEVTPDMVGKKIAVFLSVETKRPKNGVVSDQQKTWMNVVNNAGGIAVIAKNEDEIKQLCSNENTKSNTNC